MGSFFSGSGVVLCGLQLVVSRLEIVLLGAQEGVKATLLGVHGVEARQKTVWGVGARSTPARGT